MISYHALRILRRFFVGLLTFVIIGALGLLAWFLWLQRYVVYTDEGAKLDFSVSPQFSGGEAAVPPAPAPTVSVVYDDDTTATQPPSAEFVRFSGYYITLEDLSGDISALQTRLEALPERSTILIDLKNIQGEFYYSTTLGPTSSAVDPRQMDALIAYLKNSGHYIIARIPAFRERNYFLADTENWSRNAHGLAKKGGNGSLWDDNGCYWLNPTSDGALSFLIQIVTELRLLGFDEVVFTEFRYPETTAVNLPEDRLAVLNETAAMLVRTCATDTFALSFQREAADLTLPQGRTRLYLQGIAAADTALIAGQSGLADPSIQLVFLTELNDTRFDAYCALRPLEMAR